MSFSKDTATGGAGTNVSAEWQGVMSATSRQQHDRGADAPGRPPPGIAAGAGRLEYRRMRATGRQLAAACHRPPAAATQYSPDQHGEAAQGDHPAMRGA
ncbi:hypothetical protein, partial [Xanthomonas euvesicatoria]